MQICFNDIVNSIQYLILKLVNLVHFCWKHFAGPWCTFMNVLLESSGTDRPVFWRERESGLNVKAFFVAKVVGEPSDTDGNKEGKTMDRWDMHRVLTIPKSWQSSNSYCIIVSYRIHFTHFFLHFHPHSHPHCGCAWGRQLDRFGAAVLPSDFCWKLIWLDIAWSRILDTHQLAFVKQKQLISFDILCTCIYMIIHVHSTKNILMMIYSLTQYTGAYIYIYVIYDIILYD